MWHLFLAALTVGQALVPTASLHVSGSQRVMFQADAEELEDQGFWVAQWRALEGDVLRLQQGLGIRASSGLLQVSSGTVNKTATKAPAMKQPVAKEVSVPKAMVRLDKAEGMMKGLAGKAALVPMLEMLKGLYDDQKKRIGEINKREEVSKKRFAVQQADFNKRIQGIKDRHDHGKLSEEFFKNETRDYTHQFKYWEGVRSRNHRQFHNSLKITHGMMQKEKDMITQYEKAIAMKDPAKQPAKAKAPADDTPPEVVLVERRADIAKFCREVLVEVHHELWRSPASSGSRSS